jgi:hypothetical protein
VQISTGAIKVDFDSTLANVQSFSVMSAIKELLTDEEFLVLSEL